MTEVHSTQQFDAAVASAAFAVAYFWADWAQPCKQMDIVFAELQSEFPSAVFLRVEAEKQADISEKCNITVVPTFVFYSHGQVTSTLEGANAPELVARVRSALRATPSAKPAVSASPAAAPSTTGGAGVVMTPELRARLEKLVRSSPVMLFMKGSPDEPKCGFSRKMVDLLRSAGVQFGSFDILTDETVRQGLKELSNWPTYPQLYANGNLIGGLDVCTELHEAGELVPLLQPAGEALRARLTALVNKAPVMLFMKGSPDEPKCGFSRKMVDLLRSTGVPFESFDILTDETVRQGLKEFSNWPTYPQLYVNGSLLGGLDVCTEMHEAGDLVPALQAATKSSA